MCYHYCRKNEREEKQMYTIHFNTATRHEFRKMETAWGACMMAWKYVKEWGWDRAVVVDNTTGEIIREYIKG